MFDCVKQEKLALSEYVKATDGFLRLLESKVGETLPVGETKNEYKMKCMHICIYIALSSTRENNIHIFKLPCNVLFITWSEVRTSEQNI